MAKAKVVLTKNHLSDLLKKVYGDSLKDLVYKTNPFMSMVTKDKGLGAWMPIPELRHDQKPSSVRTLIEFAEEEGIREPHKDPEPFWGLMTTEAMRILDKHDHNPGSGIIIAAGAVAQGYLDLQKQIKKSMDDMVNMPKLLVSK